MIQLLVNRHDEPDWVARRMLDSIASQMGAPEFEVIIADDGSDAPLPDDTVARYPFLRYVTLPHKGMSATRNALLDMADAEYVMFCDIDDCFFSTVGLHLVSRHMERGFDVLVSEFLQEDVRDGRLAGFAPRANDPFFVHGKAFRRRYLVDNGIRWCDDMEACGDVVFLWQALCLTDRVAYCDRAFYMWRWNPDSVCRREEDHFVRIYPDSIREMDVLVQKFLERGRADLAARFAAMLVIDAYFMMGTADWERADPDVVGRSAEMVLDCAARYDGLVRTLPHDATEALYRWKQGNYGWAGPDGGIAGIGEWLRSLGYTGNADGRSG